MSDSFENLLLRLGFLENMEEFVNFGIDENTIWYLSERQMEKIFEGNIGMTIKLKLALEKERPIELVDPAFKNLAKQISETVSSSIVQTIENSIKETKCMTCSDNICVNLTQNDSDGEIKQSVSAADLVVINKNVSLTIIVFTLYNLLFKSFFLVCKQNT